MDTAGGTLVEIRAISASGITPGPLGMCETNPRAAAPSRIANAASSTLEMQQTFTLTEIGSGTIMIHGGRR